MIGRALRAGRGDERGAAEIEAVLLLPVMVLMATFTLWAGRSGQAALVVDLAAEEAATAAALLCNEGDDEECGELVDQVLTARPNLNLLCVGGHQPDGDQPLVDQRWLRYASQDGGEVDTEVAVVGVQFACETDGAVAPLRGLVSTATHYGRSTEVAVRDAPSTVHVGIDDAVADEGDELAFRVYVDAPLSLPLSINFSVTPVEDHTRAGSDYVLPDELEITMPQGESEVFLVIPTLDDDRFEGTEHIRVQLGPPEAGPGEVIADWQGSSAIGSINDSGELEVTVQPRGQAPERSGRLVFDVSTNAGKNFTVRYWTENGTAQGDARGKADCLKTNADYVRIEKGPPWSTLVVSPDAPDGRIEITVCNDQDAEGPETFQLHWETSEGVQGPSGVAFGQIIDGEFRLVLRDDYVIEGSTATFRARLQVKDRERWVNTAVTDGFELEAWVEPLPADFDFGPLDDGTLTDACTRVESIDSDYGFDDCESNTFTLATSEGADRDFIPIEKGNPTTVRARAGQTFFYVEVDTVVEDSRDEPPQLFVVKVDPPDWLAIDETDPDDANAPQCSWQGREEGTDDCAVAVIIDNDRPPAVAVSPASGVEGTVAFIEISLRDRSSPAVVRSSERSDLHVVVRTGDADTDVIDQFGPSAQSATPGSSCDVDGADYEQIDGLEFTFDKGETRKTIPLHLCADEPPPAEPTEVFMVQATPDPATPDQPLLSFRCDPPDHTEGCRAVPILDANGDPNQPSISIQAPEQDQVIEGEYIEFNVFVTPRLAPGTGDADQFPTVQVDYAVVETNSLPQHTVDAVAGVDYLRNGSSGTLEFGPADASQSITITTVANERIDPRRALTVKLSNAQLANLSSFPGGGADIAVDTAQAIIVDDDCRSGGSIKPGIRFSTVDGTENTHHQFSVIIGNRPCEGAKFKVWAVPEAPAGDGDVDTSAQEHTLPAIVTENLSADGLYRADFEIWVPPDGLVEPTEYYRIRLEWFGETAFDLGLDGDYAISDKVAIIDSDTPQAGISDVSAVEGDDLTFEVTLSSPSSEEIEINFGTHTVQGGRRAAAAGGNACGSGVDFVNTSGKLVFDAGDTSKTLTVPSCVDDLDDNGESFLVRLQPSRGSPVGIVDSTGVGTILDLPCVEPGSPNHLVPVIAGYDIVVAEDALTDALLFELDVPFCVGQPDALVLTINYETADVGDVAVTDDDFDDDFLSISDGMEWDLPLDAGDTEVRRLLRHRRDYRAQGDPAEGDETYTFAVNWSADMITRDVRYGGQDDVVVTVTVLDDDSAYDTFLQQTPSVLTMSQNAPAATEGDAVSFQFELDQDSGTDDVYVTVETEFDADGTAPADAGVDYQPVQRIITIPKGEQTATLDVATLADDIDEQNETFRVRVLDVSGPGVEGVIVSLNPVSPDVAVGTILESCVEPGIGTPVGITPVHGEWAETSGTVQVAFTLEHLLCSPAFVSYDVHASSGTAQPSRDFVPADGLVWVPAYQRQFTVGVRLLDDGEFEGDETFETTVRWGGYMPPGWESIEAVAEGVITDDESGSAPRVRINAASAVEGDDLVFELVLSEPASGTVSVKVATQELRAGDGATRGADYSHVSKVVRFASGQTRKTFTVPTLSDTEVEPHERLIVRLLSDPLPVGLVLDVAGRAATGIIEDDDCLDVASHTQGDPIPGLVFKTRDADGNPLGTALEGRPIFFEVVPSLRLCQAAYFSVEAIAGTASADDFTIDSSAMLDRLVITAGSDDPVAFSIAANHDSDPNESSTDAETFEVRAHWHPDLMPNHFFDAADGPFYSTTAEIHDAIHRITVSAEEIVVPEGDVAVFVITVSDVSSGLPVSVRYTTLSGTASPPGDFRWRSGTLEFVAGDATDQEVRVATVNDHEVEDDEQFYLLLFEPVNAVLAADVHSTGRYSVQATIVDRDTPRQPQSVTLTAQDRALTVDWRPPSELDGFVGWLVQARPVGALLPQAAVFTETRLVSSTTNLWRLEDLVPGVTYEVSVVARYTDGAAIASAPVRGVPTSSLSPPGAPQGVAMAADPASRDDAAADPSAEHPMKIEWDAPPATEDVTFSELQWKQRELSWDDSHSAQLEASGATVDQFRLGEEYDLRLRHWNAHGAGAWVTKRVQMAYAPDAPTLRSVSPIRQSGPQRGHLAVGGLWVEWEPPDFDGGSRLRYRVEHRPKGEAQWTRQECHCSPNRNNGVAALRISDIRTGEPTEVRVTALNGSRAGQPSYLGEGTAVGPPSIVLDLRWTHSDQTSVTLAWEAPQRDGGHPIESYHAQYRIQGGGAWNDVAVDFGNRTATVSGLSLGALIDVRVWARNEESGDLGAGARSQIAAMTSTVPDPPHFAVSARCGHTSGVLDVTWDRPTESWNDYRIWLTGYYVSYRVANSSDAWTEEGPIQPSAVRRTITGLDNGTAYEVRIRSVNRSSDDAGDGVGVGAWSPPAEATPLQACPQGGSQ